MIKLIQKLVERLKYGYKIDENLYLSAPSKDELVVTYGKRKTKIYMEILSGKPDRIIYIDKGAKWLPPYENEPMSEQEYQFIIDAIVRHFERLGEEVESR